MTLDPDRTATPARFAKLIGEGDAHYVKQLHAAGLVDMTEDGKRVRVEPSLAKLRAAGPVEIKPERTASFAGFARILGERSPSYVTQLKGEGRLVLTDDGKRVRVDESIALIKSTADPSKAGVVARHAADRTVAATAPAPQADSPTGGSVATDDPDWIPPEGGHATRRAKALADKAETDAKAAERDYRLSLGQLLEAEQVELTVRGAVVTFRSALENLPNTLAPQLSALTDEGRIRVVLGEAFEHALEELSRKFGTIARAEEA